MAGMCSCRRGIRSTPTGTFELKSKKRFAINREPTIEFYVSVITPILLPLQAQGYDHSAHKRLLFSWNRYLVDVAVEFC